MSKGGLLAYSSPASDGHTYIGTEVLPNAGKPHHVRMLSLTICGLSLVPSLESGSCSMNGMIWCQNVVTSRLGLLGPKGALASQAFVPFHCCSQAFGNFERASW